MVFLRSNLSLRGDAAGLEIESGKTVWLHDKGHFLDEMGKSRFGRLRKANRVLSVVRPEDVLVINGHGSEVANHLIGVHMDRFVGWSKDAPRGRVTELHGFTAC